MKNQNNVTVTPFVPRKGYHNDALNMDFYELTMANAIFKLGMKDIQLVFDTFFRRNPMDRGYSISAGQEELTDFLLNYHFDEIACDYLLAKGMDPDFVKYLSTYRWNGDMHAMKEGCVAYPNEQLVRIKCDSVGAFLIETHLLQTMNFNSLIATQATRITRAAGNRGVMEFGTRRAQGTSAGLYGARAAILGGCIGTANCLAEVKFGSPVTAMGTISHAWIELFPSEWEAFKAIADVYPDNVSLLIDTYNVFESGVLNTILLDNYMIEKYPNNPNHRVKSVRIDSGDLGSTAKRLRKIFDDVDKPYIKIVVSNGLNETSIRSLIEEQKATIDSFGVGENLITSADCPVFGGVYKLVAVENPDGTYRPTMKCSDTLAKAIIPGYKTVYRLYDNDDYGYLDLIAMHDEVIEVGKPIKVYTTDLADSRKEYVITPTRVEELLVPYIANGKLVRDMPSVSEIRDFVKYQLENTVWPEELRTTYPHTHFVDMTEKVYETRRQMYQTLHG